MNPDVTHAFLETLFGEEVGPSAQIVLWAQGKPVAWCASIDSAVGALRRLGDGAYFSVCLHEQGAALKRGKEINDAKPPSDRKPQVNPDNTRGFPESAVRVPGVWLDVDIAVDGKKKPYPTTRRDALTLINGMPVPPTMLVWTGGGFHAYWLFDEPFVIDSDKARERIRSLSYAWHVLATDEARRHGKTIDNVSDLSRVLRLLGTTNTKYGIEVARAGEDGGDEPRYSVEALEVFMPNDLTLPERAAVLDSQESNFTLNPNAQPSYQRIEALRELSGEKFERTWRHERDEGADALASQSEYDLALANYFVDAGFTDQEIVDALVWHRQKHGGKPKHRIDYYRDRIRLARANKMDEERGREVTKATETIETVGKEVGAGAMTAEEARPEVISGVNSMLGLHDDEQVAAVLRIPDDPPVYALEMVSGEILTLGTVGTITSGQLFRNAIASVTGRLIPAMKAPRWNKIAQAILTAVIDLDGDRPHTRMRDLLLRWLHSVDVFDGDTIEQRTMAVNANRPFTYRWKNWDGIAFGGADFMLWLRDFRGESIPLARLRIYLRSVGIRTGIRVAVSRKGKTKSGLSTSSVWWIPDSAVEKHSAPENAKVNDGTPESPQDRSEGEGYSIPMSANKVQQSATGEASGHAGDATAVEQGEGP